MPSHPTAQLARGRSLLAVLALVMLAIMLPLAGCSQLQQVLDDSAADKPAAAPATVDAGHDYFRVTGKAKRSYDAKAGQISYCKLDRLQRATCAYGELTSRTSGNSDGDLPDPAGWPQHNGEVEIEALSGVSGSKTYHGWMFNRSHLIADSLGGKEITQNLVTGTRTQNVGSHQEHGQYAGGMAHTELMARDYLSSPASNGCPLYYAATPHYSGDELIPRTVSVDIQSCDKSIDEHVEVSNTAAGFDIDYTTGEYSATH